MKTLAARRAGYRDALAQLRSTQLQKTTRGLPAYTRFVNRSMGRRVAAAASVAGLSPDQITMIGSSLTLVGIVLLAVVPPSTALGIAVALFLAVGFVLDAADGPLARLRGGGTPAGEWLDHVADATKHCLLHSAVLIAWYRWFDLPAAMLLVPVGFLVAEVLFFFTAMLTEALKKQHGTTPVAGPSQSSTARAIVLLPMDYGTVLLSFVLWGRPTAFVVVYGVLALAIAGYLVLVMPKWRADVLALGAA